MANLFLGATTYGSQSGMKWVMVLDEDCGPFLPGVHYKWGRPLLSIPSYASSMADMKFNQDFWTIAHMARFIRPGSHRVGSELWSSSSPNAIVEAFRDDSAQTTTLIAVNLDQSRDLPLVVDAGGQQFSYHLPRWSTVNLVWGSSGAPTPTPAPTTPSPPPPTPAPTQAPTPAPPSGGQCCWVGCTSCSPPGDWCNSNMSACTGDCGGNWCS